MLMSQAATLDLLSINTIRTLAIDAVEKANSGHPGLPLGAAPMAYVLWQRHLKHDPNDPHWFDRDRFVLSAGHGSMLLYALLHVYGYDVSIDDLKSFRQWGAKTAGHPEYGVAPGVEATTGPLGQGTANAVGMAMAERFLAARYNRPGHEVVDHHTFALVSDGDLMEGISAEAASLAGHLGLGKLVYLYDANDVSLDGPCSLHFSEDVEARYRAYGWHVQRVEDGDTDLDAIENAITAAKLETNRPSLIVVKTTIGYGSPNKSGSAASHGAPLGADEARATKAALDWDPDASFHVPEDVRENARRAIARGRDAHEAWRGAHQRWSKEFPELEAERRLSWANALPETWDEDLPVFAAGEKHATREASGKVLNAIAARVPWLFGGDADLSGSTKTSIADAGDFAGDGSGRNVRYGVREHAMGAIANGIAYHGGARTYTATFFVFSDYQRPAIRLAAMNELPVVHVFTHDSIGLGEDGPTHQPIEHLASLRAMPNLLVLRPCDAAETAEAWRIAMEQTARPSALVLSRQKLVTLNRESLGDAALARRGGYVLSDAPESAGALRAILIATGAEVHVALEAQGMLTSQGIGVRVVSMPSWELFAEQGTGWQEEVLPPAITARVSVEAASTFGWERWTGSGGARIGLDRFGASAPAEDLFREFGITAENTVDAVRKLLQRDALS